MDARNNVVMVLQNGRGATFGASNAFFNTSILAAQVGSTVKDSKGGDNITKYEMVSLDGTGKGTLTYTPVDDVVLYDLEDDGSFKSAVESTTATIEGSAITGTAGGKVLAVYEIAAPTGERITALADTENELLNVTAEVLLRDLCDQSIYYAFLFMRGKLSGEAEWGMARDGAHAFEITAMPEYCGDRKLVDIVIVKNEGALLPAKA